MNVTLFTIKFYLQKWAVDWIWPLGQHLPTHDVQHTGITSIIFPLTADGKMEA